MRSPFAIFRKHQKVLTVILTGLAMFAFVILGAVNDPSNMPTGLIVIFVACVLGAAGWVLGIRSKKSNEFGMAGVILGALLAVAGTVVSGPPAVVKADTGDISHDQFAFLQYQRSRANEFLGRAAQATREKSDGQFIQPPAPFQFHREPERDIVIGELLRREAYQLGIVVPDAMVADYISAVTQGKVKATDLKAIRSAMGLSETDLFNFLRNEILARLAYQYLYDWSALSSRTDGGAVLPPESYWEFYQQLNVRQSVDIIPVAVSAFVDESADPSDSELQKLFDEYRDDYPNQTADGRLEEGRPGFRQPRKFRLAYVEAAYDAIEATVEPPTDAEIETFYNERYKTIPDDEIHKGGTSPDGATSEGGAVDGSGPLLPGSAEELPSGKIDGEDLPPGEGESEQKGNETNPAKPADLDGGALLSVPRSSQFVAVLDDENPTEPAAEASTADPVENGPTSESVPPAEAGSDSSAVDASADSGAESAPENDPPPPPLPEPGGEEAGAPKLPAAPVVRELDDDLRGEIRDQLLRERTREKQQTVVDAALAFMRELELRLANLPEDADYLSSEQALQELRTYAEQHGLAESETPLLSAVEIQNSEDYPIGSAVDQLFSDPLNPRPATTVVEQIFTSAPREVYRARTVTHPESDSRFVYWKIEDQAEYEPQSLSDPGIREQVVRVWRELKARNQAKARAAELATIAGGADKPLSEVFADQTVTGTPDGPAISVLQPPRFSWMSKADPRLSPNPFAVPAPELTRLRSVPGHMGESFMKTVFQEIRPGEVGVAHSVDQDYFYVVRINDRTYGRAADLAGFRESFIHEPVFAPYYASDYPKLAQSTLGNYQTDWSELLLKKHHAEIIKREPEKEAAAEEGLGGSPGSYY
ncbi:MAG: hypothetical protein AB7I48_15805 [Planctomycetaceae bacterium]